MKKLNFTCPHCGEHTLIAEKPLQWIQYDVLGFDEDGDLLLDYDKPSFVDDDGDDFEIYCDGCYTQFSIESIKYMSLKLELTAFKKQNAKLEKLNSAALERLSYHACPAVPSRNNYGQPCNDSDDCVACWREYLRGTDE